MKILEYNIKSMKSYIYSQWTKYRAQVNVTGCKCISKHKKKMLILKYK